VNRISSFPARFSVPVRFVVTVKTPFSSDRATTARWQ